jgi:hypothetical protein
MKAQHGYDQQPGRNVFKSWMESLPVRVVRINGKFLLSCVFVALSISIAGSTLGASEWERNFLLIGQVFPQDCPVPAWLDDEPSFKYVIIATDPTGMAFSGLTPELARKYVRLYFPRTKQDLLENYHFAVFPDSNIKPFSSTQIEWMREAFQEGGMSGFITLGGDLANYGRLYFYDWQSSVLHDVLPIRLTSEQDAGSGSFSISILRDDPPVISMFRPLGIEEHVAGGYAMPVPREAARVWANAEPLGFGRPTPWLISWEPGTQGGTFWVTADDLDHGWWWPFGLNPNPYAQDVFLNIVFHSFGRPLPDDIELVHEVRTGFEIFRRSRLLILGTTELAEKFGANTYKVEEAMAGLNEMQDRAREEYSSGEYETALGTLDDAATEADRILKLAFRLKDEAMFYAYVIQWLVTSGTLLLSGSVLYSLMVRRRLYRDIESTRFGRL